MKKLTNWIVVVATVALVVLPIFYGQFRSEIARWHLAAAANAAVIGGSPESHVERAVAVYPAAEQLRDYWLYRVKRALADDPAMVPDELRGAMSTDRAFVDLCDFATPKLWMLELFPEYVEAFKLMQEVGSDFNADELNQFAYARSIIGVDLDEALVDIDRALEMDPGNLAYRDTRAWVLFQMGRPIEALDDANFAIRALQRSGTVNTWLEWLAAVGQSSEEPKEKAGEQAGEGEPLAIESHVGVSDATGAMARVDPNEFDAGGADETEFAHDGALYAEEEMPSLSRAVAGEWLWGNGALYYHRARILEALGRDEEAESDWKWLKDRNLPLDGSLY